MTTPSVPSIPDLAEALAEAEATLALMEHPAFPDPVHHERVKALGRAIGFGALMSTAEAGWREVAEENGHPAGMEFVSGPCRITVDKALAKVRAALEELSRLKAREPDHCYDEANWEYSIDWKSRDMLTDDLPLGEIMKVPTLFDGPYKFAVHVVVTRDADGDADQTEVQWFDTEAEARAALPPAPGGRS